MPRAKADRLSASDSGSRSGTAFDRRNHVANFASRFPSLQPVVRIGNLGVGALDESRSRTVSLWLLSSPSHRDVKVGYPSDLLEAKTRTAQLTVVGSRGRGSMKSRLLDSLSREVLNRAWGPVMVVPTGKERQ